MNNLMNTCDKLKNFQAEKIRLDVALGNANRVLRSMEISLKVGKSVDGQKLLEARNWVKKLEGRMTLVESSINVLGRAVQKVASISKHQTASGKRIRL